MISIDIINQCNFNCFFCAQKNNKAQILTLDDIVSKIVPALKKLKISTIRLTPDEGEIFLHKDIYKILSVLSNLEHVTQIQFFTNFEKINLQKYLKSNIKLNKIKMDISYYGINGVDEFKAQTQMQNKSFERVEQNINAATELGIAFTLHSRTLEREYTFDDIRPSTEQKLDKYCLNAAMPQINCYGDLLQCSCRGNVKELEEYNVIGNIFKEDLYDLYTSYKRYEFFLEFNLGTPKNCFLCCTANCVSDNRTFSSYINFNECKKNYSKRK